MRQRIKLAGDWITQAPWGRTGQGKRLALTGMVWLPCRLLMAACASAWLPYFTKAQPKGREGTWERLDSAAAGASAARPVAPTLRGSRQPTGCLPGSPKPTFASSVGPSEDGALLDLAEGLEEAPDVVLALLLPQHAHKELPVF